MALDALLSALRQEAERTVEQLLTAAREEAARLRTDAVARVEHRCAEAIATREAELKAAAEVARARAQRAAAVGMVQARDACLERIFSATDDALAQALDSPDYATAPGRLATEALAYVSGVPVVVKCRASLADKVRVVVQHWRDVAVVPDDTVAPGVWIEAIDGSVIIDNTVGARLRRMRPLLSIEVLERIGAVP
jgi:vacuolar-type H+-ATPase subunit E/Vma4